MLELVEPLNLWLSSRDLERARRFYGETLGLQLWREEPREALHFGVGGGVLSIRLASDADLPPRGSRLVLTLPLEFDETYHALEARGVVFEQPIADRPFGRSAMFRDPDGHELWIVRPSETETQFYRWRQAQRQRSRRVPVQRQPKARRHEPKVPSRRSPHPTG